MKKLTIIADQAIPLLKHLYHDHHLVLKPGHDIKPSDLMNADALLVRTVTKTNASLLSNTPIKFVGSATAGIDHLDTQWLTQHNIHWAYAKGVNAKAVSEYVLATLAYLITQKKIPATQLTVGIVGMGCIGSLLADFLTQLNYNLICYDPPRAARDSSFKSAKLNELFNADVMTLHANLTKEGDYPSHHFIDKPFLNQLKPNCILINTARGEMIDTQALINAQPIIKCIDTWENEPNINLDLLQQSVIATPHIAGYSLPAKTHATLMIDQQLRDFFKLPPSTDSLQTSATSATSAIALNKNWHETLITKINLAAETEKMKQTFMTRQPVGHAFTHLRKTYVWRGEYL